MTDFEINLLDDLKKLKEILLQTHDINSARDIKIDIIKIENLLIESKLINSRSNFVFDKNDFDSELNKTHLNINDIILNNNCLGINLKKFKLLKKINDFDSRNMFLNFLDDDKFKLKSTYDFMKSYNGIGFTSRKKKYKGCTLYIKSMNINYIEVCGKDNIYNTLIHELGHAYRNTLKGQIFDNMLSESYPIFLELIYADYYKEFDFNKESFNIKRKILCSCITESKILYDYLDCCNSNFLKYSSKMFLSTLFAIYLYNVYINDKVEAQKLIHILNNDIKCGNEEEILNKMGLSLDEFKSTNILNHFISKMHDEKEKIKLVSKKK